jgi:hypothetical protein
VVASDFLFPGWSIVTEWFDQRPSFTSGGSAALATPTDTRKAALKQISFFFIKISPFALPGLFMGFDRKA